MSKFKVGTKVKNRLTRRRGEVAQVGSEGVVVRWRGVNGLFVYTRPLLRHYLKVL